MNERVWRLFIGLMPDASIRQALADSRARWEWQKRAALVAPDKLHCTLHFIGDVAATRAEPLLPALALRWSAFELHIGAPALWHGGIAVRETTVPPALSALHAALGDALLGVGFEPERRPYRPHVTLARHAQGAFVPELDEPLRWHVDHYALVLSEHGRYTVLQRYPATD